MDESPVNIKLLQDLWKYAAERRGKIAEENHPQERGCNVKPVSEETMGWRCRKQKFVSSAVHRTAFLFLSLFFKAELVSIYLSKS